MVGGGELVECVLFFGSSPVGLSRTPTHLDAEIRFARDVFLFGVELGALCGGEREKVGREKKSEAGLAQPAGHAARSPRKKHAALASTRAGVGEARAARGLWTPIRLHAALRFPLPPTPPPFLPPHTRTLLMNVPHVAHRMDMGSIMRTFNALRSARLARGRLAGSKSGG